MKFKWSWKAWYAELILGAGLAYLYIVDGLLNYEEAVEVGRVVTGARHEWYSGFLSIFDTLVGKTATLIIIGTLTLIPFVTAGYKLRKIIKKRREQKQQNNDTKI